MTLYVPFAFLALALAAPAAADDALLAAYRGPADACWARAEGDLARAEACNGVLSEACMEGEPGGMSNTGMSQCLYAEAAFWDEKLNQEWARVMALVAEADTADRAIDPGYAVREDKLRAAQRAWIAFRDAQCGFDYSIHGGGSMRLLYYPSCLSDMTYARVRDLLGLAVEFGG
jgi:uncharacterized protein YecT (DUF1311 family)